MRSISFSFDPEKVVQTVAFFAEGGVKSLTKLKAAKLLYFADKMHLLRHGRPILGDTYFCLDNGPIPSAALNILSEAAEDEPAGYSGQHPIQDLLVQFLEVVPGRYPEFKARQAPDMSVFSESEVEVLQETLETYGGMSASELIEATHREPTWTIPNQGRAPSHRAEIPYQLFFEGAPEEAQALRALVEAEQEQRDFASTL